MVRWIRPFQPFPPFPPTAEVALQLLHLFSEVTTAAVAKTQPSAPTGAASGPLSPILRGGTAASASRATQVAAARALGRVAAASSSCRSTVISVARDQQLLVRLLPALRCPLTMEEVEVRVPQVFFMRMVAYSGVWTLRKESRYFRPTPTAKIVGAVLIEADYSN